MSAPSVLVIDIGTSSVRATVVDATGTFVAHAGQPLTLQSPGPGAAEQHAEDWWSSVVIAVSEVMEAGHVVAAVTVTNQQISTVPVDAGGAPLAPAMLWMDQRPGPLLDELPVAVGEQVLRTTGMPLSSSWSIARPLWWRDQATAVFAGADAFLTVDAFVYERLCGRRVTDPTNACFSMMNIATDQYDAELGDAIGVEPERLPEIAPSASQIGVVSAEAARLTRLPAGTPVVLSGSDQPCAALGMGVVRSDQVAVTTGTGTFVIRPSAEPALDGRLFTNRGLGDLRYVLMGLHYVSGAAWNWFVDTMDVSETGRAATSERLLSEVWTREPGRAAPLLVPYFSGARTPHFDDEARATWSGMTLSTTRSDLAYSVLESNGFGVRQVIDAMDDVCGGPAAAVRLAGGPASSSSWCQLQADASGIAVERVPNSEATTLGAAITVLVGLGAYSSTQAASVPCVGSPETFTPAPSTEHRFAARRAAAADLYLRTKGTHHV